MEAGRVNTRISGLLVVVVVALAAMLAGCGGSSKPESDTTNITTEPSAAFPTVYPAPKNPMALAKAAGLVPETAEQLRYHVHSHLDVFIQAERIQVPAGLGVDITNPGVHTFTTDG
jgi:type IV pilus biogenesis protein CpaD/CtpE